MTARGPADGQPLLGQLYAGRYEIEAVLGRGGMGAVYRALDRQVGDRVALKTLLVRPESQEQALRRFRREVRLARRITDRHVARIHDLNVCEDTPFLTMEYVDGDDLDRLLERRERLGSGRVAGIGRDICSGLAAAHEVGVIHRDLKPANVMVERDTERIVITDFGIARSVLEDDQSLKTTGTVGTPVYMAPEQVAGGVIDARTDLYALGVLLFELLVGEPPFAEATAMATALARLQRPAPDVGQRVAIPRPLAALVNRLLARHPDSRPATAAEVGAAFEPLASDADSAFDLTVPGPKLHAVGPTLLRSERTLAVLPFAFRGDHELGYLGEALADGLVDVLSRTRGLRVLSRSATSGLKLTQPGELGSELGADVVVEGAVHAAGKRLRVTAKLIESGSGMQLWSERFDAELVDIFTIEDTMSRRIAEALRLGLTTMSERGNAPAEAIECYLRARGRATGLEPRASGPTETVRLYERCLKLAPDFRPAMSGHAVACLVAWSVDWSLAEPSGRDWEAEARASVARTLERADDLAESHIAAARLATQDSDMPAAARALERALAIAPTCAEAHQLLGILQCEAGDLDEGVRRLSLSVELDSTLLFSLSEMARYQWLAGDVEGAHETVREVELRAPEGWIPGFIAGPRLAAWERNDEVLRAALARIESWKGASLAVFEPYFRAALGDASNQSATIVFEPSSSPRLMVKVLELIAEAAAMQGNLDEAVAVILRAEQFGLFDLAWIEGCPLLHEVRQRPEVKQLIGRIRHKVLATWNR